MYGGVYTLERKTADDAEQKSNKCMIYASESKKECTLVHQKKKLKINKEPSELYLG
jgi:hypothetical protein